MRGNAKRGILSKLKLTRTDCLGLILTMMSSFQLDLNHFVTNKVWTESFPEKTITVSPEHVTITVFVERNHVGSTINLGKGSCWTDLFTKVGSKIDDRSDHESAIFVVGFYNNVVWIRVGVFWVGKLIVALFVLLKYLSWSRIARVLQRFPSNIARR